jgi:uroporphyrinogen decarboxylase
MNHRERVMAAIQGKPVDRVPMSFWLHNFAEEHSAKALSDETVRLYRTFGWDFLKPQSRASCFAEMWGTKMTFSTDRTVAPKVRPETLRDAKDIGAVRPADPSTGALGEQVEALRSVRASLGPDVPIVATIFAPLMVATYMVTGGRAAVLALMREDAATLERGLQAIGDTLGAYARTCITVATKPLMSAEECRRFQRPYDLPILEAAKSAPFNIMHVCGDNTHFDEFIDYPVSVFSWATTPGNPKLLEVRERSGRGVLGGLPGKPHIGGMSADALVECAHVSLSETGGRHHLLGPDCSINPGTPDELLHAVGNAVAAQLRGAS